MGLDDFISDDNSSTGNNDTSSSSTVEKATTPNQPSHTYQSFGPSEVVSPRQIKFQIKSVLPNHTKQFSTMRSQDGEVVYYGIGGSFSLENKALAVFTGIRAFDSEPPYSEDLDILIQPVDLENKIVLGEGRIVEYTEGWSHRLVDAIEHEKNEFVDEHL